MPNPKAKKKKLEIQQVKQAVQVLGEYFRSSLGPKGLDKLLYEHFNNYMIVTNDGGTILQDLKDQMEPQLSKFVLKWGQNLKKQEGDGIKTFYLALGAFLKECETLSEESIPKAIIIEGIRWLKRIWKAFYNTCFVKVDLEIAEMTEETRNFLQKYLVSILRGKLSEKNTHLISEIAIEIVERAGKRALQPWFDIEKNFQLVKVPGSLINKSRVHRGFFLGKLPTNYSIVNDQGMENARIVLIREKMYIDLPDGGEIGPQGPEFDIQLDATEARVKLREFSIKRAKETYKLLSRVSPDVVITEKGTSKQLEGLLERNGILLVRRAKPEEFQQLSRYLGVEPVDNLREIQEKHIAIAKRVRREKVGKDLKLVLEKKIGTNTPNQKSNEDKFEKSEFLGSILACGSLWYACETVERLIRKAIRILINLMKTKRIFYGGGNTELRFIRYVLEEKYVDQLRPIKNDKVRYALNRLVKALYIIPVCLAESGGIDSIDAKIQFRAKLSKLEKKGKNEDEFSVGVNAISGKICNVSKFHIFDNYSAKTLLYERIFETLEQLERIDKVIGTKHRTGNE